MFIIFFLSAFICLVQAEGIQQVDPDFLDSPEIPHEMKTEIHWVDGYPMVRQYNKIVPSFETYKLENPVREYISLNGSWKFKFDEKNEGSEQGWSDRQFDDMTWGDVQVPSCWDMYGNIGFTNWGDRSSKNPAFYDGVAWYRKKFKVGEKILRQRSMINFLGVNYRTWIYLNDQLLARHEGGHLPFSIDVSDYLTLGENQLSVKVLRLPDHISKNMNGKLKLKEIKRVHSLPTQPIDLWPYAGIYRDVYLESTHHLTVSKILLNSSDDKIEVRAFVSNFSDRYQTVQASVSSDILRDEDMNGLDIKVSPNTTSVLNWSLPIKKIPSWSPDSPHLFEVEVVLKKENQIIDSLKEITGKRSIRVHEEKLTLNSNQIFLKGVSWAEETKNKGASLEKEDYEKIFSLAIQANCNFLRFSTHGRHPLAYECADQMGLMVMSEWDTFWMKPDAIKTQLNDPYSMSFTATMVGVWDRVNNPSVILWGLHNESDQFNENFIPFLKQMKKLVRTIDWQNRLVSYANWHPYWGKAGHEISDVVGFNEYRGFFDPFEKLLPDLKKVRKKYPGKLMLITENGAWSKRGYHGDKSKGGSEKWHAHIIEKQMSVIAPHKDWFAGYTFWKLTDYRSRKDDYTKNNDGYSLMGMYDPDYLPKLVRDTVKNLVPEL